jgi:hypothetical protein
MGCNEIAWVKFSYSLQLGTETQVWILNIEITVNYSLEW